MLRTVDERNNMTRNQMCDTYRGYTVLYRVVPDGSDAHGGIPVAYSDAADMLGLKRLESQYRNDNIEVSMCNADDFGTLSVERWEVLS